MSVHPAPKPLWPECQVQHQRSAAWRQQGLGSVCVCVYLPGGCAGCGERCQPLPGCLCEPAAGASLGEVVEPCGGDMGATSGLMTGHGCDPQTGEAGPEGSPTGVGIQTLEEQLQGHAHVSGFLH